jgi:hypothetical protein
MKTRTILAAMLLFACLTMPFAAAIAEDESQFLDKAYARLGLAIGWPNVDSNTFSGSTGAGLSFVGGYNIMKGLAAEVEFVFTAGTNAELNDGTEVGGSASNVAFTVNAKAYPLDFFSKDLLPSSIRPYGVFGLGGGSIGAGDSAATGVQTIGAFLVRFGGGADWMFSDKIGAYADGSYYVTSKDIQTGYGTITMGMIYAF